MIYISSACSKQRLICPAVKELVEQGFRNIELTGGTKYYDGYESDLLELKKKYDLNFLVHNYFPPPKDPFILNLASLDTDIYEKSLNHLRKALRLTRLLEGKRFGFHAGFFVDRPVDEIGRKFGKSDLYDKQKALKKFIAGFHLLKDEFKDIDLYIENNCYSESNYMVYGNNIPFMLLTFQDFNELKKRIDFTLLLDVGHLMVSAKTFCFDFKREFQDMFEISDYIHISDNNQRHDQNIGLTDESKLFNVLNKYQWENKIITLEIYEGFKALNNTYEIVSSLKRRN
ncbi:TIM barrel protein [Desulfobacula toluolica]|uniref:Xylose isormerase domain protein, TIM barrel n=1 Tax=Desulfobacula toluolica (strain DSM 7467 / Tol2) TaxID=651182 RepID=K0NLT1_DESTT|nr:TIM barrel protein [Desulfobacula toluolica]CCK81695.1 xylose isormerase domain protein, TIM barrel [Desulfobacula toluolica Tol2]